MDELEAELARLRKLKAEKLTDMLKAAREEVVKLLEVRSQKLTYTTYVRGLYMYAKPRPRAVWPPHSAVFVAIKRRAVHVCTSAVPPSPATDPLETSSFFLDASSSRLLLLYYYCTYDLLQAK